MRKSVLIIAIIAVATTMFTSCASYRSSGKSGCKATQGYVGYGSTR
jgi:predicted small secreted protein